MELILWRHAEAEEGTPDKTRKLTGRGEQHARQMAAWLKKRLPKKTRILVSPATRTLQTVQALTAEYEIVPEIGVDADPVAILAAAGWPDASEAVLVVGHQPTLGRVISLLLAGDARDWSVKKGAVWWLSNRTRRDENQTVLRGVVGPQLV